jgi:hypothetical protein
VIAFGTAITQPETYRRYAEVGIRRAAEPDSVIFAMPAVGSIFASYNALLERAHELEGLEALVLIHQDAEIADADFCARLRDALSDPEVGVVGCVGAIGVRSIAWWEGSVSLASFIHRYEDHGGGDLPAFSWVWEEAPAYARVGEVDTIDGFVMALSPWTVRNLRFDGSVSDFHGYDFDFCLQVREQGRKVVTADFRAIHNHPLRPFADPESWIQAHIKVAEKWEGRFDEVGFRPGTWEQRAHRASAERDLHRLKAHTEKLRFEAELRHLERAREEARTSLSWRLTAPLRQLTQRKDAR